MRRKTRFNVSTVSGNGNGNGEESETLERVFLHLHNEVDELRATYIKMHEALATLMPYAQSSWIGKFPQCAAAEAWVTLEDQREAINESRRLLRIMQHIIWDEELDEEVADLMYASKTGSGTQAD